MTKDFSAKIDLILLSAILLLLTIGLFTVYSATYTGHAQSQLYFNRQLIFVAIGLISMLVVAFTPLKLIQRLAYPFYGLSILLLILVFFLGVKGYGAERWLAFGSFKLQPSELAKLATILAVARYLSSPEVDINKFKHLLVTAVLIFLPFLLIAKQPDLGTSLVFLALLIPLLYWAGLNWFILFILISPFFTALFAFNFYAFLIWMFIVVLILIFSRKAVSIMAIIFILHITVGLATPAMWAHLRPYQQQRILTFANPEKDPKGSGYQIIQSKVAIGSGGLWGKGYLNGTQTQLRFLPAQHTDFIFSVIGEEWGFMGVMIVLALFLALLFYLLYLAVLVKSVFSSVALIGILTVLFFHVVVNIGMTIGLAPVTGLPLPFISYGGSFLISTLTMMGCVLNFSMNRFNN